MLTIKNNKFLIIQHVTLKCRLAELDYSESCILHEQP